jgi:hypothetical protein
MFGHAITLQYKNEA